MTTLTPEQIAYLSTQTLGRLATVNPSGAPQNSPVGFTYNAELGTIDIGGHNLGASKKFRNLATNDRVSFVVDDIVSTSPWLVRMVEIRGTAQALSDLEPTGQAFSGELIRIHPQRVISFGLNGERPPGT